MKRSLTLAIALAFASGVAYAAHCPSHVKAIDEAMKTTKVADAKKAEAKKLRDEGDKLHKDGKHAESMTALHKSMDILGLKHEAAK